MNTIWPTKKLGEIAEAFSGTWGPVDNSGTAVLRSTNFNNDGTIVWNDVAYRSIPSNKIDQLVLNQGDILLEKSGGSPAQPVGRVVYFDQCKNEKVIYSNFISKLQVKNNEMIPKFLFYYLLYFYKAGNINKYQSQTTGIRNLQLKDYLGIEIPKFGTNIQKKIVERLDAIRKAQELCNTQIQKTEELYESVLGKEFSSVKTFKKMVDVAEILMGQSPPSITYNHDGKGLPFFQGKAEFGNFYPKIDKYCSAPVRVAETGDILLSVRAPVGPINIAQEKICIGRGLSVIRAKKELANQWYLYYFLKQHENSWAGLTGSTFQSINRMTIENLKIPISNLNIQEKIVNKLDAIRNTQNLLLKQKSLLKELFDSVLYKSMNGEMD